MADNRKYIQGQKYQLAGSGISSSDTSLTLESFKFPGTTTTIVTADIGSLAWCTLEPGTEREEIITFTTITQNSDGTATLSGVTRGIGFNAPYTTTAALQKSHGGGTTLIITNNPGFYDEFANKNNDETVAGYWEVADPITAQGIVPRDYMLGLINGGAVSTNALIETGTAGETVAAGNLVYLKAADSRWWKADADLTATIDNIQLGIAQGAGTAGASITGGVLRRGVDSNQSAMAIGLAYISNTAGALATTAGTIERVVGNFLSATTIDFDPNFYYLPTKDIKDASVGSQGIPKSTNKYVTQDNLSASTTDQTQTTQDGTVEVGEADTTTKKKKIAQSFIPAKTKIRGVTLYKLADTGTFTGTVTITLEADTAGSPSGSALATRTLTNTYWRGLAVGANDITFTSEYASLTVGSLYWIVVTTSTSDTLNHPNLGTNTAGGYSSGSAKYNNTTDGWVAIATIDLYFKTLEGNVSQLIKTNTSGKMESNFYDITEMPLVAFQQLIPMTGQTGTSWQGSSSNQTGSVLIANSSLSNELFRYERDSITGMYFMTHNVSSTAASGFACVTVLGDYVYMFYDGVNNVSCYRYDLATLANETVMTVPALDTSGTNYTVSCWNDGSYVYVTQAKANTVTNKWSLSGTTFSAVSTSTTSGLYASLANMYDGTSVYVAISNGSTTFTYYKLTDVDGSSRTTLTKELEQWSNASGGAFLVNIDTSRMYLGRLEVTYDEDAAVRGFIMLYPITKP
jgi:hypothetical protein